MTSAGLGASVALKENSIQLVTDIHGDIGKGNTEGYGLYLRDTRHLSTFELRVNNLVPIYLSHSAYRNYIATFQFVNSSFGMENGTHVPRQTISIRRTRFVDDDGLRERVGFYNCNQFVVEVALTLDFDADFLDMFTVRKYASHRRGGQSSVKFGANRLIFSYTGRDHLRRLTEIGFDRRPEPISSTSMVFKLILQPHKPEFLSLRISPVVGGAAATGGRDQEDDSFDSALATLAESYEAWHRVSTTFRTNNELFDNGLLRQSRFDLRTLVEFTDTPIGSDRVKRLMMPDAGIPWYAVPFGRDSIITALQTLSYNPGLAEGTLRVLAHHQGRDIDRRTEEEPGKIFHELRRGELANLKEIPHTPYFGTVDATPLFVVLFVEAMSWFGDSSTGQELYQDLMPSVLAALAWVDRFGDVDGDGYVEYRGGGHGGVRNQGWKDSSTSLQNPDGSSADLPAALVEVQGYVYQAKMGLSILTSAHGDAVLASRLHSEAGQLKSRFNRDFWMESEGFFAQALDGQKRHVQAITSNAGHALWSGIADADKAERVVQRVMSSDMNSGWGIRTLSSLSPNFNPMSYHNGSVWPHDNSLIAAGMKRYGFDSEAAEVINGIISAGVRISGNRLPELFCGFDRDRRFNSSPAAYIVSCSPQAWAAAAPFLLLQTLLGVQPLTGNSIRIEPTTNELMSRIIVNGMRIGEHRVDFEVHHRDEGWLVMAVGGDIELVSDTAVVTG